nr:AsmA family protein [uncultured Cohaesibacter sp.]
MTKTIRIRILWSLLAFLVLIVGLVLATPYLINTRVVKKQIAEQISDWMGLPVTVSGEPVVTVFPYLTVKLRDVEIASGLGGKEPPLVSTQTLRAEMYWLPLLIGDFEVRRFHLIKPKLELIKDADGAFSWDLRKGSLFKTDDGSGRLTLSDVTLGNFRISGGVAHYQDRTTGEEERFTGINMMFDWPSTEDLASINGSATWRGEKVELRAQSGKPMELFGGGLSPLSAKLSSPMFSMSFNGSAATISNFQFEGDFSFDTPALGKLAQWLERPLPAGRDLGPSSLSARANLIGASIAFSDLDLKLDDNQINGVLQLDFRQERPMVQGTLASDDLDLAQFVRVPESLEDLMAYDLTTSKAAKLDFDIRISSSDLKLGPINLGQTAASLMTRDNQVSVSIGEAYAYGGRLEATFDMRKSANDPTIMISSLRAKANGISAGGFTREILGNEFLNGTALVEIDLQAQGSHVSDTLADAHGALSVVLTDGELQHFDIDVFENALQQEKDLDREKLHEGDARFDVLSMRGQLANQRLDVEGLRLTSGKRALLGTAQYDFAKGELSFPGTLAIYKSSDPATHSTELPEKEIPFLLSGSFDAPHISLRKVQDAVVPSDEDILAPGVPAEINPSGSDAEPAQSDVSPINPIGLGALPLVMSDPESELSIKNSVIKP